VEADAGLPTGCACGTLRVLTRGLAGAPLGAATSSCFRWAATCCTACACCLASARAAGGTETTFTAPFLAAAICVAGISTVLLFTVVLLMFVLLTLVTFVTFVTLVTLLIVFCWTRVRGGQGILPALRPRDISS